MLDSTLALFLPVLLLLVHQVLAEAGAGAVTHLTGVAPVTRGGSVGLERRISVLWYEARPRLYQSLPTGLAEILQLCHQQLLGSESHLDHCIRYRVLDLLRIVLPANICLAT